MHPSTSKRVHFSVLLIYTLTLCSTFHSSVAVVILSVGDKCDQSSNIRPEDFAMGYEPHVLSYANSNASTVVPTVCDPSMPLECISGRCQCKRGLTISRNGTKCLEIARNGLDSPCDESIQCWKGLLGRLSECRKNTGRCRCYESETLPIVFHQGR
jgi:hypothetical protein